MHDLFIFLICFCSKIIFDQIFYYFYIIFYLLLFIQKYTLGFIVYFVLFFVQKSFLTKNHFHTAEINLTTEGPLYTCLVEYDMTMWFLFYFLFSVAGANPTEPVESEKGKTALHIAAAKGHMDILLLLVYKVC